MKPLLLNPDGSIPNGLTPELLQAFGLAPVIPSPPPVPSPGFRVVEDEPLELLGSFFQIWKEVPLDQSNGDQGPVPDLAPAQFSYLLSVSGLEELWEALEATLKDNDRKMYATLRGSRHRELFRFEETMKLVGLFSPYLPEGAPVITREFLEPLWLEALAF